MTVRVQGIPQKEAVATIKIGIMQRATTGVIVTGIISAKAEAAVITTKAAEVVRDLAGAVEDGMVVVGIREKHTTPAFFSRRMRVFLCPPEKIKS